jgi:hypothetical protein
MKGYTAEREVPANGSDIIIKKQDMKPDKNIIQKEDKK